MRLRRRSASTARPLSTLAFAWLSIASAERSAARAVSERRLRQRCRIIAVENGQQDLALVLLVGLIGDFDAQAGLIAPFARSAEIPDRLLHRRPGLQVVRRVRRVERRKRKILDAEFLLRQERSEHEHRIVSGQIGLFEIQAGQIACPRSLEFKPRSLLARSVHGQIRIAFQRAGNCCGQGERFLGCKRSCGQNQERLSESSMS